MSNENAKQEKFQRERYRRLKERKIRRGRRLETEREPKRIYQITGTRGKMKNSYKVQYDNEKTTTKQMMMPSR